MFISLSANDDVIIATQTIQAGYAVEGVITQSIIPKGHKIAISDIPKGCEIRKYGQIIGYAAEFISKGAHVHSHNVEFRNTDMKYKFGIELNDIPDVTPDYFTGYRRENGQVGTRNYIAIITSVNCSATAARMIADYFTPERLSDYPNIDGVCAFTHGTGCGMAGDGEGFEALQRVMWGYAKHPNHAAVLMLGLGCEMNQIDWLLEAYGLKQSDCFQTMNIQNVAGLKRTVEVGIEKIRAMLPLANQAKREKCTANALKLALQCGGSDAWSGVTANPALGYACDLLVAQGGSGVLAETPEVYGAEHLLVRRAINDEVGQKLINKIQWWEDYVARNKGSMDNNPSPGNKAGGLTTILEKSLGAVSKGGKSPMVDVLDYAAPIKRAGFQHMDSPGYDPASVTGQIASGCNLVCFTTGRGSAFGSKPAPTLKIATNSELARRMSEDMDINAGTIISEDVKIEDKGREIYKMLLRVASGERTKSEAQGLGDYEFVPWQIGAVM